MRKSVIAVAVAALSAACVHGDEVHVPLRADSSVRQFGAEGPILRYVVLGDSTVVSEGGDYERGIAIMTAKHLARGHRVELRNFAVSGARVRDVLVDQLQRADLSRADVVLLDIGANDVIHLTRSSALERDLERIIQKITAVNCRAKIVVTGAPDMSTPPRIPRMFRGVTGYRSRRLNVIFRRAVSRYGLTFAPIAEKTGPLFRSDKTLFSADRFHPNDRGYATWTAVINEALDGALTQPSRCG